MTPLTLLLGDCRETLKTLPDGSVNCCVTSPPYFGLRDYGTEDQMGLEDTPDAFVEGLVSLFREVHRVLRDDGTVWLNLGDSYSGSGKGRNADGSHQEGGKQGTSRGTIEGKLLKTATPDCKAKDLIGIPWRVAFALQAAGWYLRQDIIWHKPNPMPESVKDRCTKAHEYIFLLSKAPKYYFDSEAMKEPLAEASIGRAERKQKLIDREGVGTKGKQIQSGVDASHSYAGLALGRNGKTGYDLESGMRNKRSVWTVTTKPYKGAHFATFPPDLIEPCVLAGCPAGGTVLDPFGGSGTTAGVAIKHGRNAVLCELSQEYVHLIPDRISKISGHPADEFTPVIREALLADYEV